MFSHKFNNGQTVRAMIMDLPKHSTPRQASDPAQCEDMAMRDETVPAGRGQAAQATLSDQSSYEAAISEGWSVAPHWHGERRTEP